MPTGRIVRLLDEPPKPKPSAETLEARKVGYREHNRKYMSTYRLPERIAKMEQRLAALKAKLAALNNGSGK